MDLTENQIEIIRLLKILGVDSETIIPAMLAVQEDKKAEEVLRRVLELEDKNEEVTGQKVLRIMTEV